MSYTREEGLELMKTMHTNLGIFWLKYGNDFKTYWKGLEKVKRRELLLITCPHMPLSKSNAISATDGSSVHGMYHYKILFFLYNIYNSIMFQ